MAKADRELRFAKEFLIDGHGTKAAIRAGFPPKSAHVAASRLLKKDKIRELIDKARADANKLVGLTAERVTRELARLAFSDPRKMFRPDGTVIPIHELDDDTAAAIAGYEVKVLAGGENPADADDDEEFERRRADPTVLSTQKIKMWNKGQALELAMKHLGMLIEPPPPPPPKDPEVERVKDFLYDMLADQAKRAAAKPVQTIDHQPQAVSPKPTNGSGHGGNGHGGNGTKR